MRKRLVLREQQGSALVITLLIITTLVGLTVAFSEDSSVELSLAGYSRNGYLAYQLALGGCALGQAVLQADLEKEKERPFDSLREDWALLDSETLPSEFLQEGSLSISIVDESSKFNLNKLRDDAGVIREKQQERLSRLFRVLELEEDRVIPILDWLDADDEKRLEGAEDYYYQSLAQPYPCGNGPFLTVGQIFLVKGLSEVKVLGPDEERRLVDFLTIYSDGKININTAPVEVLQALDESIDRTTGEAIIEYRKDQDFATIEDLKMVPAVTDQIFNAIKDAITVKSSGFTLEMEGQYQESKSKIRAVVLRDQGKSKLVYWQVS